MFLGIGNSVPISKGGHRPPDPGFEYDPIAWCQDDGAQTPTVTGDPGGVFSYVNEATGTATGLSSFDTATGAIGANSTPGSYAITYTVNGVSETDVITISPDVSTSFTYPSTVENRFTVSPTQAVATAGVYSFTVNPGNITFANGAATSTTGEINLTGATLGSYTVQFLPNSSCGNPTTASFTVVQAFESFEFTIQTSSPNETFTIPTTGSGYSYHVDWGTGTAGQDNFAGPYTGNVTSPVYNSAGTYTVKIGILNDTFPRIYFNNGGDKDKMRNIVKWGEFQWTSFLAAFSGCSNLDVIASDTPDLSNCNNFNEMFFRCFPSLTGTTAGTNWNWTFNNNASNFGEMFRRAGNFNGDISNWNTSKVTDMNYMFAMDAQATKHQFDQNIGSWDVGEVTNMSNMFNNSIFNQDIGNWDTSKVTSMSFMLSGNANFNQDINTKDYAAGNRIAWDVSACTDFQYMFSNSIGFSTSVNKWKIHTGSSNVNMNNMFAGATSFNSSLNTEQFTVGQGSYQQTYLAWDIQKVNNLSNVIKNTQVNTSLSNWDTSNATTIQELFKDTSFNQPLINQQVTVGTGATARTYNAWDVSNITNMYRVFRDNNAFNQDLSSWDINTSGNVNMSQMFYSADSFDQDLSNWTVTNVNNFSQFLNGVALSTNNYDAILTAWDAQGAMAYSGTADFGDSVPSCDNAASNGAFAARASLITKWGGISDKFSQNNTCQPLAGFNYTSTAYCANGSDVTPTITGTVDQTLPLGGNISDAWSASDYFQSFKFKVTTQTTNETFTFNGSGSYHIDWGDGNGFQGPYTNAQSFQYSTIGQQNTVTVGQSGDQLHVSYSYGDANVTKITEISQWMEGLNTSALKFQHTNTRFAPLNITATNVPGFRDISSGGSSLYRIFANLPSTNGIVDSGDNLSKWNLNDITDIGQFFGPSGTGVPTSFNPNTKQVTYNNETYLAWDIKNVTSVQDSHVQTSTAPTNWDTLGVTNFTSLELENIQVPYQSVTVGSRTYNQWDISDGVSFQNLFSNNFDNTSPKDWILGSQLSNTNNRLWFSYPAPWGGASNQSDNYTNCWIGWAITIYNGVASKGYSQHYLTNLDLSSAHVHYNGKFNNSLAINSTLHPNAPSSWSTAQDAADYLVNTQGWTVNTGFF